MLPPIAAKPRLSGQSQHYSNSQHLAKLCEQGRQPQVMTKSHCTEHGSRRKDADGETMWAELPLSPKLSAENFKLSAIKSARNSNIDPKW